MMKKNILVSVLISLMFSSNELYCISPPKQDESEIPESKIPSLCKQSGQATVKLIEKEAEADKYMTLSKACDMYDPETVQELTFGSPYRPRMPFNVKLMGFMPSVDLSKIDLSGDPYLKSYFKTHPNCFSILDQQPNKYNNLKTLNIEWNRLEEHVRVLQPLTALTDL